jgi:hypothetical protein
MRDGDFRVSRKPGSGDAVVYPFIIVLLAFAAYARRKRSGCKARRLAAMEAERHMVEA